MVSGFEPRRRHMNLIEFVWLDVEFESLQWVHMHMMDELFGHSLLHVCRWMAAIDV
jgi:hypothetical protein